jgi:hypothetical protein
LSCEHIHTHARAVEELHNHKTMDPIDLLSLITKLTPFLSEGSVPRAVSGCEHWRNPARLSSNELRDLDRLVRSCSNEHEEEKTFVSYLESNPRVLAKFCKVYVPIGANLKHELARSKITDEDDMDVGWECYKDEVSPADQYRFAGQIRRGLKGLKRNPTIAMCIYARLALYSEHRRLECVHHMLDMMQPKSSVAALPVAVRRLFPRGCHDITALGISIGDYRLEARTWTRDDFDEKTNTRALYITTVSNESLATLHMSVLCFQIAERSITDNSRCIDPVTNTDTSVLNLLVRGVAYLCRTLLHRGCYISSWYIWNEVSECVNWPFIVGNFYYTWTLQDAFIHVIQSTMDQKRPLLSAWLCALLESKQSGPDLFHDFTVRVLLCPQSIVTVPRLEEVSATVRLVA